MKAVYGTYEHIVNGTNLAVSLDGVRSNRGQVFKYRKRIVLRGRVEGTDQDSVDTEIASLEAAYRTPNLDWQFQQDDGTPTAHSIDASAAINGVVTPRITWIAGLPGSFGSGSQFVNRRDFILSIEAEFDAPDQPFGGILSWQETLVAIGDGGPEFFIVESMTGSPVRQDVIAETRGLLVQSGSALGYDITPTPPTPIFPTENHSRQSTFSQTTPVQYANSNRLYGIRWKYVMEDVAAMAGTPTISVS